MSPPHLTHLHPFAPQDLTKCLRHQDLLITCRHRDLITKCRHRDPSPLPCLDTAYRIFRVRRRHTHTNNSARTPAPRRHMRTSSTRTPAPRRHTNSTRTRAPRRHISGVLAVRRRRLVATALTTNEVTLFACRRTPRMAVARVSPRQMIGKLCGALYWFVGLSETVPSPHQRFALQNVWFRSHSVQCEKRCRRSNVVALPVPPPSLGGVMRAETVVNIILPRNFLLHSPSDFFSVVVSYNSTIHLINRRFQLKNLNL